MVSVRQAIERMSLDDFADMLAPDVVWIGFRPRELCRNRDDVLEMFARMREREQQLRPRIVAEQDDLLVVDPGLDGRHHLLVLDDGLVSEVRVYPDRRSALAAAEDAA
ncbi:MAG TPA: nuclear transport factor 2 family protein [Gaiellaceae bacterium]|nr:nuclear transport factor 2 family protein [Gaiellaceae bacterium]